MVFCVCSILNLHFEITLFNHIPGMSIDGSELDPKTSLNHNVLQCSTHIDHLLLVVNRVEFFARFQQLMNRHMSEKTSIMI